MPDSPLTPALGKPHHCGYLVANIEATVERLVSRLGAGPFILIENVPLENVRSWGEPARLDHSSAFGSLGGNPVELLEITHAAPRQVEERWSGQMPRLQHVGYALPQAAADEARAELERRDLPAYLTSRLGETENSFHGTSSLFGHDIEIQIDAPAFRDFFAMVLGAAEDWDGTEPLRRLEV